MVADEVIWKHIGSQLFWKTVQVQLIFLLNSEAVLGGYSLGLDEECVHKSR